jgi:SAM-dependent methyltransferase
MRPTLLFVLLAAAGAVPVAAQTPDVMFVPTNIDVALGMLRLAGVGDSDVVYDLGSGDGRLVIAAAKRYGARGVGIDIDPSLVVEAARNADTAGVTGRVSFRKADLFQTPLGDATVVTLYLTPSLNLRLRPKLLKELRPGARVVSNNFDMGEWEPDSMTVVQGVAMANTPVRMWVIPADVGGTWRITADGLPPVRVRLEQQFQRASGTARIEGRGSASSEVRLIGDSLTLTIAGGSLPQPMLYVGRVRRGSAAGFVERPGGGAPRPWQAVRIGTAAR